MFRQQVSTLIHPAADSLSRQQASTAVGSTTDSPSHPRARDGRPVGRATRTSSRHPAPQCHSASSPAPTTPCRCIHEYGGRCARAAKRGRINDHSLPSPLPPRFAPRHSTSRRGRGLTPTRAERSERRCPSSATAAVKHCRERAAQADAPCSRRSPARRQSDPDKQFLSHPAVPFRIITHPSEHPKLGRSLDPGNPP